MTLHTRTDAPAHEAATNAPTPHAQPANARHRACPPLLRCWTRPRRAALDRGVAGAHEPPRSERVELGDKRAWRRQRREHEAAARTRGGGAASPAPTAATEPTSLPTALPRTLPPVPPTTTSRTFPRARVTL
jgi:hypothetical protein